MPQRKADRLTSLAKGHGANETSINEVCHFKYVLCYSKPGHL